MCRRAILKAIAHYLRLGANPQIAVCRQRAVIGSDVSFSCRAIRHKLQAEEPHPVRNLEHYLTRIIGIEDEQKPA